jgi:DNA polymerase III alpha subunit (gram-positive type)
MYADEHVVYVDVETTGLDPERHEVWDIALIDGATGEEHEFHIRPEHFHSADEGALRITKFYERVHAAGYIDEQIEEGYPKRTKTIKRPAFWTNRGRGSIAAEVAHLTANKHLVGAVPSFDARFIAGFLLREQIVPAWHYHLIDIEALAAGWLGMKPPWDSDELNNRLGLPAPTEKHTAIADARWARAVYERVLYERGPA